MYIISKQTKLEQSELKQSKLEQSKLEQSIKVLLSGGYGDNDDELAVLYRRLAVLDQRDLKNLVNTAKAEISISDSKHSIDPKRVLETVRLFAKKL